MGVPGKFDFFDPPTTHFVANIEDLIDILNGMPDEAEDEEEEADDSAESRSPATGRWTTTSTYDLYMVDTPNSGNNGGGSNDAGNGDGNNGAGNYANGNDNGDYPDSPSRHEDGNPRSEFAPYDEDILNESLDSERHDECRQRLIRSAKKLSEIKMCWPYVPSISIIVGRSSSNTRRTSEARKTRCPGQQPSTTET